ncbi:MAG TPA: hypothetical protein VFY29_05315 [Terriglobia bacterium]|nr:hypothetical protein [Terriglobia bacterium]
MANEISRLLSALPLMLAFVAAAIPGPVAAGQDTRIVSYEVTAEGPLKVTYSDGAVVKIPKERGRFTRGDEVLTQESFKDIHVADDRRHIGWLADYMMCPQSYPCSMALVIFQAGASPRYISPEYGIPWKWRFQNGGKEIVMHSGFTHGDADGIYTLWDTDSGPARARYAPGEGSPPAWVQDFLAQEKAR